MAIHGKMQLNQLIYKIVDAVAWREAELEGVFRGAEIDLSDGYIHFSAAHQVRETLQKHFRGKADLLLVAVEESAVEDGLRWEPSRAGDLFPHLYRELKVTEVRSVVPINENSGPFPGVV